MISWPGGPAALATMLNDFKYQAAELTFSVSSDDQFLPMHVSNVSKLCRRTQNGLFESLAVYNPHIHKQSTQPFTCHGI
jgi:hypothetical protein